MAISESSKPAKKRPEVSIVTNNFLPGACPPEAVDPTILLCPTENGCEWGEICGQDDYVCIDGVWFYTWRPKGLADDYCPNDGDPGTHFHLSCNSDQTGIRIKGQDLLLILQSVTDTALIEEFCQWVGQSCSEILAEIAEQAIEEFSSNQLIEIIQNQIDSQFSWCNPETGMSEILPSGESIITENNRPKNFTPNNLSYQIDSGLNSWVPGNEPLGFSDTASEISEIVINNPDLCRSATATILLVANLSVFDNAGSHNWSASSRHYYDDGSGNLVPFYITAASPGGGGPSHPTPGTGIGNNSTREITVKSAVIPPGGSVTVRAFQEYTIPANHHLHMSQFARWRVATLMQVIGIQSECF